MFRTMAIICASRMRLGLAMDLGGHSDENGVRSTFSLRIAALRRTGIGTSTMAGLMVRTWTAPGGLIGLHAAGMYARTSPGFLNLMYADLDVIISFG
uniref:Putative secreted protein n=1 Tax=Anopheles darlingi TaxID=43151 RepID=A0A2M4D287_ANODA